VLLRCGGHREQDGGEEREERRQAGHRPYHARIDALRDLPITQWWPFRVVLVALAALALAGTVRSFRRHWWLAVRLLGIVLTLVLGLANAAAAVNAHYAYFPTLGDALGLPPPDESTLSSAEQGSGAVPATGSVVGLDVPATRSHFAARQTQVYLPPAWFARPRPALPVVVLLHGSPGDPTNWTEGGAGPAAADAWAGQHGGVAPVLVMPDINGSFTADTECVDSPLGNVETYLTLDLPGAVVARLGTRPPGRAWAVAGLSEGGSCALMLALRHPDLFTAFGDYSGLAGPRVGDTNADTASTISELFGGSRQAFEAHEPADLLADPGTRFHDLGGWFEVGSADADPLAAARQLAPMAARAGIDTCLVVVPGGGHTFDVWRPAFQA
jgi:S-formylglutathione hydrolase FrmB